MTAPRQVVPGWTYLFTRRCLMRMFLLRPDEVVEVIYSYCLAEAAERFNITLHGWTAMSNHQHVVFTDNEGNYPAFLAHLDRNLAKALNAHWGRWESVWASSQQPNIVRLVRPEDAFDKLIYTVANPVAGDLVEQVADWPGATSLALHLSGRSRTVERPRAYFRDKGGKMPATVTLSAVRIPGFEHLTDAQWTKKVADAVKEREQHHSKDRRAQGILVLGRKAILRTQYWERPAKDAPRGKLRPYIACRDKKQWEQARDDVIAFRKAHRVALERLVARERGVVFPFGTYRVKLFGVRCADLAPTIAPSATISSARSSAR